MSTTRIILEAEHNPRPLGRHVDHDPRSLDFPHPADAPVQHPVMWAHSGPVLDQGQLGSCTGNAITQALATGPLFHKGYVPSEKIAVQIYELATHLDSIPGTYPPNDTGSSGLGVAKAAKKLGYIASYQHAFGITHARAVIAQSPFIAGTDWYDGMFTPDPDGHVHLTGQIAGGHEYLVLGYDPVADLWTMLNSWGTWGIGIKGVATTGLFHLAGPDFAQLLAAQGDIVVPVR